MPSKDSPYRRAYTRQKKAESQARNRAFVAEVNARTVCAHCGAQPIEWHNPEHVKLGRQRFRIGALIHKAAISTIQAEMARCTPLCRRCHMREDGRLIRATACEWCGATGRKIAAAHDDYSKPLDVVWLCYSCHGRWDATEPKLAKMRAS